MNDFLTKSYNKKFQKLFPIGFEIKEHTWETITGDLMHGLCARVYVEADVFVYAYSSYCNSFEDSYSRLVVSLEKLIIDYESAIINNETHYMIFFQIQIMNKVFFYTQDDYLGDDRDTEEMIDYNIKRYNNDKKEALKYILTNNTGKLLLESKRALHPS